MLTLAAADTIAGVAQTNATVTVTIFGMELNAGVEVYKVLYQGQPTTSAATLYTAPASTQAFIKSIHVVNTAASTQTFQLFRGGTAGSNAITPNITLPLSGGANYEDGTGWQIFDSTGKIQTQGMTISSATPTAIDASAGAAGTSLQVSAADHDHLVNTGTPVADTPGAASAAGSGNPLALANHTHQSPGGVARIISDVAIANTETVVAAFNSIPSAILNVAGVTFRLMAAGTLTTGVTPGSGIFRVRIGPTTLTGVIPATMTLAQTASVTTAPFAIMALVTVRSTGASGTLLGNIWVDAQNGAAPIAFTIAAAGFVSATTATVTADLTVSTNRLEFTYISGNAGSTATFRNATWELIQMT